MFPNGSFPLRTSSACFSFTLSFLSTAYLSVFMVSYNHQHLGRGSLDFNSAYMNARAVNKEFNFSNKNKRRDNGKKSNDVSMSSS